MQHAALDADEKEEHKWRVQAIEDCFARDKYRLLLSLLMEIGRRVKIKAVSGIMLTLMLVGFFFMMLSVGLVTGWSNGGFSDDPSNPDYGTHDWIAQHALDWLPAYEKQYILDNLAAYLYGTELPDNGGATDGIGDTVKHHIYYWSNGSLQDDASAVRASEEYYETLNFLRSEDFAAAAKAAGIMSHYIVDVAVFGHVMGAKTDWGSETHHSDYETYVNQQTSSYDAEFNVYLSFDGELGVISACDAAKELAFDTTFDVDGDLTCVWMDENYDWSNPTFKNRAGESLNLAVNCLTDILHTLYLDAAPAEPRTWTVDDDGPADFSSIQEAVNAARPGDTIYVRTGKYYENIFVNKTVSLIGENLERTIIDGSKSNATFSPVVYLFGEDAKDVNILNFTIRGSNDAWGIYILSHANAWIEKTIVVNNSGGIVADFSDNNTFINNTITNNKGEGILFFHSSGNVMRNNTISGNKYNFGIFESSFIHDIDTSNLINGKPIYYLKNRRTLIISPSNFSNVGYLALINCTNITVENLNLTNNYNGLLLVEVKNSTLRNNTFENNLSGIEIIDSSNNTIQGNNVTGSSLNGISLVRSSNNKFSENNLVGNQLGFKVRGNYLSDFLQDVDLSNTLDGKVIRYLISRTDLVVSPSTFDDTGYLALVNCYNITAENFSLENNEILVAFTQNSSVVENTITSGGIELTYSSFINLTDNIITNGESGISIYHSENNRVGRNNITQNWDYGIHLQASSNNTIFGNNVKSNNKGIRLSASSNNTIFGNNIADNRPYGLILLNSSYNKIFHNNFINNSLPGWQAICSLGGGNNWDNGYPSGGNYWSDYAGQDLNGDGVGDTPYPIYAGNADHYPLMGPFNALDAGTWNNIPYHVNVASNSTVSDFYFNPEVGPFIRFNVTGSSGTTGFCRVSIPKQLLSVNRPEEWIVVVGNDVVVPEVSEDENHTYLYFTYPHSTKTVTITGTRVIPEFPTWTQIILILIVLTVVIAIHKQRIRKTNKFRSQERRRVKI